MIDFQYHTPNTLEEVFDLLNTYGEDARVMAGGTALVIQMKQRLLQPEHVINLRKNFGTLRYKQIGEWNSYRLSLHTESCRNGSSGF